MPSTLRQARQTLLLSERGAHGAPFDFQTMSDHLTGPGPTPDPRPPVPDPQPPAPTPDPIPLPPDPNPRPI